MSGRNTLYSPAVKPLSQFIIFNTVKIKQEKKNYPINAHHHLRERETPFAIYVAVKIYAVTRKESLIDALYEKGVRISYQRLRTITTDPANSVIEH